MIRSALLAMLSSGARPRPISQLPHTAEDGQQRAAGDQLGEHEAAHVGVDIGGRLPDEDDVPAERAGACRCVFAVAVTVRQATRSVGDPGTERFSGCPAGAQGQQRGPRPAAGLRRERGEVLASSSWPVGEPGVSWPCWPVRTER